MHTAFFVLIRLMKSENLIKIKKIREISLYSGILQFLRPSLFLKIKLLLEIQRVLKFRYFLHFL